MSDMPPDRSKREKKKSDAGRCKCGCRILCDIDNGNLRDSNTKIDCNVSKGSGNACGKRQLRHAEWRKVAAELCQKSTEVFRTDTARELMQGDLQPPMLHTSSVLRAAKYEYIASQYLHSDPIQALRIIKRSTIGRNVIRYAGTNPVTVCVHFASPHQIRLYNKYANDVPLIIDAASVTPPSASSGPVFAAPVGNQTAAIGREAIFTCSIRNIDKYKVGWLRTSDRTILSVHARTVTHNTRISVTYESGGGSGGPASFGTNQSSEEANIGTWRLHIRHLKESDRDCYMCQINTSPMRSEEGCLDILVPPDIVNGGETSADLAVSEGDNATLTCRATGRPAPRVSWRREDSEPILTRSPSLTSSGVSSLSRHDTFNGSSLQFHRVERKQMGAYLCIASNDVPPAVSKRVTLAVNFAPAVKVPNQLLGAPLGTDVQLECYVEAFPNTINYWLKHRGEMLLDGPKYSIREERSGYRVLMWLLIRRFTQEDVGTYNCVSTNSLGKAEGTLRLYEIKIFGIDNGGRGSDHISIHGGLAEAARGSGATRGCFHSKRNALHDIGIVILTLLPRFWHR